MKNVILLHRPPFRRVAFPLHLLQALSCYRFFLFVTKDDYSFHKQLATLDYVKELVPTGYTLDKLTHACNHVIEKHGEIFNIVYLTEECVQLAGLLRQHYGLSKENLNRYVDKKIMLQKLITTDIRKPRAISFNETEYLAHSFEYLSTIERTIGPYPFFIKPTQQCGSAHTHLVNNQKELVKWITAKDSQHYLIQEYIEGTLFHCESFIRKREILYSSVFEYSQPGFAFASGLPVGSISLPENNKTRERICEFNELVLEKMGIIDNGIAHLEVFLNQQGELIFLEIAARPPGLVGDLLYQKHLNISIEKAHFLLQLGEYKTSSENHSVANYAARYIFPVSQSGRIVAHTHRKTLHSTFIEDFRVAINDNVKKSKDLFNVAGTMVLWHEDYSTLRKDFLTLSNHTSFIIQPI